MIAVCFGLLCTGEVLGQEADQALLEKAQQFIKKRDPGITDEVLAKDRRVIQSAYPEIAGTLASKGFKNPDINDAVAAGWKNLRATSAPYQVLNASTFIGYTGRLGRLEIESLPAGASIFIDGERQEESTDTARWLSPRTYRISLEKPGYLAVQDTCVVVEGRNPPFRRVLTRTR